MPRRVYAAVERVAPAYQCLVALQRFAKHQTARRRIHPFDFCLSSGPLERYKQWAVMRPAWRLRVFFEAFADVVTHKNLIINLALLLCRSEIEDTSL